MPQQSTSEHPTFPFLAEPSGPRTLRRRALTASLAALAAGALIACGGGGKSTPNGTAGSGGGTGSGSSSGSTGGSSGATSSSSGATSSSSGATSSSSGGSSGDYVACPLSQFPTTNQLGYGLGAAGGTPSITQDTTWTKDNLYIVIGTLEVTATLTVEAGTTVCFGYDTGSDRAGNISVAANAPGALQMNGTAASPITLTSLAGSNDFWGSISAGSSYTAMSLAHVDFYNAAMGGSQEIYAFDVEGNKGEVPAANLDQVSFHGLNGGQALRLVNHAGLTAGSHVTVASTVQGGSTPQYPVIDADPYSAGSLLSGMLDVSATVPANLAVIHLAENNLDDSVTWQNPGLPFYSSLDFNVPGGGVSGHVVLTLMSGVTWKIDPHYSIYVGGPTGTNSGDLVVQGSAQGPVVFTPYAGTSDPANAWGGIFFLSMGSGNGFDPAVSTIDHARLEYGGSPFSGIGEINCHDASMPSTKGSALLMVDGNGNYMGPTVTNTAFSHSAGDAVRAHCDSIDCLVSPDDTASAAGNTFDSIAGSTELMPLSACP